jgi:hypothetical protein
MTPVTEIVSVSRIRLLPRFKYESRRTGVIRFNFIFTISGDRRITKCGNPN